MSNYYSQQSRPRQEGPPVYAQTNSDGTLAYYDKNNAPIQPQPPQQVYGQNSLLRQASGAPNYTPPYQAQAPPQVPAGQVYYNPDGSGTVINQLINQSKPPDAAYTCFCGNPAGIYQVKKPDSPHLGQWFASCANKACKFKKWNIAPPSQNQQQQQQKQSYPPIGPRLEMMEKEFALIAQRRFKVNNQLKYLHMRDRMMGLMIEDLINLLTSDTDQVSREDFCAKAKAIGTGFKRSEQTEESFEDHRMEDF